ncbi:MAG: ACP S-malonyltransferase [Chlorobiaceae bacterium]
MKAFVFPGQGSQYCGMGKDIFESFPAAQSLMERANEILGYSITEIMFSGEEKELRLTKYTQPAIFLHSMTVVTLLGRQDIAMTAGHSLGEYTALCVAGSIGFDDALRIVAKRGELMQNAAEQHPGAMAAIIGMPDSSLQELLAEASKEGVIQTANFNSPGQVVLSGEITAIKTAVELAPSKGARMAKELMVSGAFHSSLMKPAEEKLAAALELIKIRNAEIPVCMNAVARSITDAAEIRNNLILQLTSSVLWSQSIEAMVQNGITEFVEIGPQKVLQGLIKRIDKTVATKGIDTATDIQTLV